MATAEDLLAANKIPENLRMLQRVMVKLKEEKEVDKLHKNIAGTYLERAAIYTGLQTQVLKDLKNSKLYQIDEFVEIDRGVIYDTLASFYLEEKFIPSTRQLFDALYMKIPPYIDIRTFRKTLAKMGFVWKRKYNTVFACVVIENPSIIFERYEYLKNIIDYRNQGKTIYFIDENALASNEEFFTFEESKLYSKNHSEISQQRVIYAVSKTGVHSVKFIDNFDEDTFTKWVVSDFLPIIEEPSVIVFNNAKHHREQLVEPPNSDSLKIEIYKWLEYHNIPFTEEMSKYDLLKLTEDFTEVDKNMYKIDRIINDNGYSALCIPDCIKKLTPSNLVCNLIKENKELFVNDDNMNEASFIEAVESIPMENFRDYDAFIANHEKDIYTKDVEIDKVFDDLMASVISLPTRKLDVDTDLPSCSDSED